MNNSKSKHIFFVLTGDPGVGKTTLIKKICASLKEKGVQTSGFYTEEVRNKGTREGFDVVTLEGVRGKLARDEKLLNAPVKFKVGKYGVLIQEFESVALPAIKKSEPQPSLLVIDEIGKMELFSDSFKLRVRELAASSGLMLTTIPLRRGDPLVEGIRNSSRSRIWLVTRENRNGIQDEIMNEIITALQQVPRM